MHIFVYVYNNFKDKTFSCKSMSEKTFRTLQEERIVYSYIGAILKQILFSFDAVSDYAGDCFIVE